MGLPPSARVLTPFARSCAERGWQSPSLFVVAFAEAAADLGEDVSVTARQFHRWRAQNPPCPRAVHLRVLHALFGVPPQEMGFPVPPHRRVPELQPGLAAPTLGTGPESVTRDGDAAVKRREFFTAGAGLGAAALGLAADAGTGAPAGQAGPVGLPQVRELRRTLTALYALDDAYGADDVLALGLRHLRRVRRVINTGSYPDSIGRQLRLIAGETAEHCGWLSFDANLDDDACRFWGEALTAARLLPDDGLEVLVLADMCTQARYNGRPRDARDLAQAAQQRAAGWASPTVLSMLVQREALALARMNDETGARRALSRAMRLLERNADSQPTPDWARFHGTAALSQAQGLLFIDVGHYKAAVPYLQAALAQQKGTYGRNRLIYRLDLASATIRSGDVDEGCAEIIRTAEQFGEVQSGRARDRLSSVRRLLDAVDAKTARETAQHLDQIALEGGQRV
jgi:tetratricopeptide (TPR) repeat protein